MTSSPQVLSKAAAKWSAQSAVRFASRLIHEPSSTRTEPSAQAFQFSSFLTAGSRMPLLRHSILFLLLSASAFAQQPPQARLDSKHHAFLEDYCIDCHRAGKEKGKVRLDDIAFTLDTVARADLWQKVLNQVNSGEMPPEDEKQPDKLAKTDFLEALSGTLVTARQSLGDVHGKITMRRLNRREYKNTIRDLLGVELDVSDLPPDTGNGAFDTVGSSLFMSSDQVEQYLRLGRRALQDALTRYETGARQFKLHQETEKEANVQTRNAMDIISRKSEPARRWHAEVDAAAARPENANIVRELRAMKEVQEDARRFYRRWKDIAGAPPPTKFGYKDAAEAEMSQGEYDAIHKYQERYLGLPKTNEGSYLFIFRLRHEEDIKPSDKMPPGRYVMRFRIAALDDTPPERRYVELGRPGQPGSYDIVSTHQVTGTMASPQVIEAPVTLTSTDRREFAIREKRLNSREHEVALWVLHEKKNKDWLPPSMWIDWIELEGPLPNDAGHGIFSARPVREIILDFTTRAFRGTKPDAAFVDGIMKLYETRRTRGDTHEQALTEALSIVLAAPGFLYLSEPAQPGRRRELTTPELAARLAYFLWSAPPDDELLAAEDLHSDKVLEAQMDRLLASPKSRAFTTGFVNQWLGLDRLDFFQFNAREFPEFDDSLKAAARAEVLQTFEHLLRTEGSLSRLLKSDEVVVNGLLASFYGLRDVTGDTWRPVKLPADSPRGGLLGMSAILAMGSNGELTSPVERGAWMLRKLLHDPPPPAPPNVPQLSRLADRPLSPRERLLAHQEQPQCAQCHRKIDPLGFGLENFDAIGRWRATETYARDPGGRKAWPIDAGGAFFKGPVFSGYFQLRDLVAARSESFARGFTEALVEYALGRPFGFADEALADDMVKRAKAKEFSIREILRALVVSREFRTK
jgi:Protein of unknown function (DUF1592)/Protein of unknown function (DUF1588)/Protein of unknown function (DUF1587)/Protein of unknown function (DUF1585)/Protein of unknown function (DUF1595)/Planctomycete cytochrome C